MDARSEWSGRLALLVGAARSGTTLLRLLLDAHPEVGCPAEAGIPQLIRTLGRVWLTIDPDRAMERAEDPQPAGEKPFQPDDQEPTTHHEMGSLPPYARTEIRQAALAPMRRYCEHDGKKIYCDKSLDSVHHLAAVSDVFPETRYVLLFRHVLDTVASGIEASPWGFQAYGYLPFMQRWPDNAVAALVNYWLNHVESALEWETAHQESCHRVRYEDLVTNPERVLDELFDFLGVHRDMSVLQTAFHHAAVANGPGDYKVTFTNGVDTGSIGRGKRVPVGMIPPSLLEAANAKLAALGYDAITEAWNSEPLTRNRDGAWSARLAELMGRVQARGLHGTNGGSASFAIVAQDGQELRWVIDASAGTIQQGDGEVESVVTGTAEDLVLLLSGQANPGVLLRSGRIRHLTARNDVSPGETVGAMRAALLVLQDGSTSLDRSSARTIQPGDQLRR